MTSVSLRSLAIIILAGLLSGCTMNSFSLPRLAPAPEARVVQAERMPEAVRPGGMDVMISKYAATYDVPESLIRRVIMRESGYNPAAHNGPYYGLMQIRYETAQSMGYRGPAAGLLDADTNLRYAVKYLGGAYLVGGRNADQAVRNYSHGYYYAAKHKGLLEEVGLR